jgi:tellurite resistance protein
VLIIWGSRGIVQSLGSGTFRCPVEDSDQTYWHQRARRWFTFFFIPIFPTGTLAEYVECASCSATYYMSVLEAPTVADMGRALSQAVRAVVAAVATVDQPVTWPQETAAIDYVRETVDDSYSSSQFHDDCRELAPEVIEHTSIMGDVLNDLGKEQVVSAGLYIASMDGDISEDEMQLMATIAASLGMAPNHLRGVIQSLADSASG